MEATELRIGNLVFYQNWRTQEIVHSINVDLDSSPNEWSILLIDQFGGLAWGNLKNFDPIPVNSHILAACGFEHYHMNPRLENFYYNKQPYYPVHIYESRDGRYFYNENLEIKHVHQLQNLYFALTGEELAVKL
jgi:hypothetical protein